MYLYEVEGDLSFPRRAVMRYYYRPPWSSLEPRGKNYTSTIRTGRRWGELYSPEPQIKVWMGLSNDRKQ